MKLMSLRKFSGSAYNAAISEIIDINPKFIQMVKKHSEGITTIVFSNGDSVNVEMDRGEVVYLLNGGEPQTP